MSPDRFIPAGTHITHEERMSDAFHKFHLSDGRALHRFTAGEPDAEPHDHPGRLEIEILAGSYVEQVFDPDTWSSKLIVRYRGTRHVIEPQHIHRIPRLLEADCWTLCRYGPHVRESRFWRWTGRVESRAWNEAWPT